MKGVTVIHNLVTDVKAIAAGKLKQVKFDKNNERKAHMLEAFLNDPKFNTQETRSEKYLKHLIYLILNVYQHLQLCIMVPGEHTYPTPLTIETQSVLN